jgi:hypothetical protein
MSEVVPIADPLKKAIEAGIDHMTILRSVAFLLQPDGIAAAERDFRAIAARDQQPIIIALVCETPKCAGRGRFCKAQAQDSWQSHCGPYVRSGIGVVPIVMPISSALLRGRRR